MKRWLPPRKGIMATKEYTGITRVSGGDRDKALSSPAATTSEAKAPKAAADKPRKESPKR